MAYIDKIEVKYWRYFEFDKELPLKAGINLILGKNGSGKTSLLRMIQDSSVGQNQSLGLQAISLTEGANLVTITVKEGSDTLTSINQKTGDNGTWSTNVLSEKVLYITSQRSITSGNNAKNPLAKSLGDISISEPGQSIDVAEEFNKAMMKELFDKVIELTNNTGFLNELEQAYQSELIDFEKVLKIDPQKENAVYFVDYKDRPVAVSDLSSGEKEYLYFYAFLRRVRAAEGKIILIDEPELHLHSSQIRKLCEMIGNLAIKNQVIIATHSGEVLQHFISQSNIILLSKGKIEFISSPEQMQKVLEETGLPIDPSVFTAHWICAENEPTKPLQGGGATTPEVLSWIFGKDLKKRYWSFGSSRAVAQAYGSGIAITGSGVSLPINITPVLDGDKLIKSSTEYASVVIPEATKDLAYFPFWELENIFLCKPIIEKIIPSVEDKTGYDRFWELVNAHKSDLIKTLKKTIIKNYLKQFSPDRHITSDPEVDMESWKQAVQSSNLNLASIDQTFESHISLRNWQWLPGKEVLGICVSELGQDFWIKIRELQQKGELQPLFLQETTISSLINKINGF